MRSGPTLNITEQLHAAEDYCAVGEILETRSGVSYLRMGSAGRRVWQALPTEADLFRYISREVPTPPPAEPEPVQPWLDYECSDRRCQMTEKHHEWQLDCQCGGQWVRKTRPFCSVTKSQVESAYALALYLSELWDDQNPPPPGKVWMLMGDGKLYLRSIPPPETPV